MSCIIANLKLCVCVCGVMHTAVRGAVWRDSERLVPCEVSKMKWFDLHERLRPVPFVVPVWRILP